MIFTEATPRLSQKVIYKDEKLKYIPAGSLIKDSKDLPIGNETQLRQLSYENQAQFKILISTV